MKKLVKTLPGKTLLFVLCILSTCILAASIAGMVFFLQDDMYFYKNTEQDITYEIVSDMERLEGEAVLLKELAGYRYRSSHEYNYKIRNKHTYEGIIEYIEGEWDYTTSCRLTYSVLRNTGGFVSGVYYQNVDEYDKEDGEYYEVFLSPIEGSSAALRLAFVHTVLHIAYSLRYAVYPIAFAALILMIATFVGLMYASGRRAGTDELVPGLLDKVPYDLLLIVGGGLIFTAIGGLSSVIVHEFDDIPAFILISALCIIGLCAILGFCMSAAGRIKRHAFLKNTVICMLLNLLWKALLFIWTLIKNIPLIWKTALAIFILSFLELIFIAASDGSQSMITIFWLNEKIILVPIILYFALTLRRLQKSGEALAAGDLTYHTDTKGMFHDLKKHGENLNNIAAGMSIAVEEKMKSERMKTVLITNVSHDIKTPLTSVINYSNLIVQEQCDNPKIAEYTEVLLRQSEKLKRLIEDLVEASKASTGNLEVVLAPCDASVFLSQASGEYEEKLKNSELTLITKMPEKELRILADGRRMWRIFDNLMNNICKYSLPGTRVYLSLEEQNGKAVITFKNTSREPLDMSEEELMERFTRGDSSRNTEGNGLGLSIAKSMAELQNGHLRLDIDGDLFKAILSFPLV